MKTRQKAISRTAFPFKNDPPPKNTLYMLALPAVKRTRRRIKKIRRNAAVWAGGVSVLKATTFMDESLHFLTFTCQ